MFNLKEIKKKPIAVLGAGAVGKSIAADCVLAGQNVRIYDLPAFAEKALFQVERSGIKLFGPQENLYGFERSGTAKVDFATDDIQKAVAGAGLIIVATCSVGHEMLFEKLIPCLEDGQIIHIFPDNYGTLLLRKMMRKKNCTKKIIVGGWSSAPYGTRVVVKGGIALPQVEVLYRAITLRCATLPSTDQDVFMQSTNLIGAMDSVTQGDGAVGGHTVLDTGFSNVNPILHCPGSILGVSTMENWGVVFGTFDKKDFSIYSHAYCPSISKVQYALYQEEVALAEAIGVGIQPFKKEQFFSRKNILGSEFMGDDYVIPFEEQDYFALRTGPHSIYNRYITEDIPVGCRVYHELGKKFGVKTPIIDSMISLASVMTETDYLEKGYSLDYLGIGHLNKEELLDYLENGNI